MTEPATVTIQAYPAGTEHWFCDAGEVRRVRVTDVTYSSRRPDLAGQVIHSVEPVAQGGALHEGVRDLVWDTATAAQLYATEDEAKAAVEQRRSVRSGLRVVRAGDEAAQAK